MLTVLKEGFWKVAHCENQLQKLLLVLLACV